MKKIILTAIVFFAAILITTAQVKIKGKVTDISGKEVKGVIVLVKGTNVGTVTDSKGNYIIEAPNKNAVLVFMNLGTDNIEKNATASIINVTLNRAIHSSRIILFDKYGNKVFQKEDIDLSNKNIKFLDFMTQQEFDDLKADQYFYSISKGKLSRVGYLTKYTKEEQFFRGGCDGQKKTPYKLKMKIHNLCKDKKVYLEIDDKKTQITQDTILYGAKITMRNSKFVIDGAIPYEEKASLYIGDKEVALDSRRKSSDNLFVMNVLSGNEKEETFYIQGHSYNKLNNNVVFKSKKGEPLLLVDGVILKKEGAYELSLDTIEDISILKDYVATSIYGEQGTNGAIIITTKNRVKKPLIILDGVPQPLDYSFKQLSSPDMIESISVLRDKAATLYGKRGANGVIIITTKKK